MESTLIINLKLTKPEVDRLVEVMSDSVKSTGLKNAGFCGMMFSKIQEEVSRTVNENHSTIKPIAEPKDKKNNQDGE